MSGPLSLVLSCLKDVSPQPSGGYKARCPAHDDQNPSLSVTEGDDGQALLHCHAGCPPDAVVEALGLSLRDLYPDRGESGKRRIAATYDYYDADAALSYQVVRYEPKDFRQRQPDGAGGWVWNLKGTRPVPYRLPEILAAVRDDRAIYIVEGEKDADRLADLGLEATTLPGGAGKWRPAYAEHFRGARVVVIPDNDGPGRDHARQVAQSLQGAAQFVGVLELPGLPEKGDVSDWLARGGNAETLAALPPVPAADWLGTSPEGKPEKGQAPTRSVLAVKSAGEWMEEAARQPTPRPLFGSLWFEGEMSILFASTNVGKSILAVQIAEAVASGREVPGFPLDADPGPVLYLDFELSAKQFEMRYTSSSGVRYSFASDFLRAELDPDAFSEEEADEEVRAAIEAEVIRTGCRRVIVDNITFIGRETEKSRDARPLMRALHRMKRKYGLSMLVLAHTPKRDETRPITLNDLAGSRHLANFADAIFALGRSNREKDARYVKQLKVRSAELERHEENVAVCRLEKRGPFLGLWYEDDGEESEHIQPRSLTEHAILDAEIVALAESEPHLSQREIARRLKTNHKKVGRALNRAGHSGTGGTPGTPSPPVPTVPVSQADTPKRPAREGGTLGTPVPPVPLQVGAEVETPAGPGTVEGFDGEGNVSVEIDGLPVRFPISKVSRIDGGP